MILYILLLAEIQTTIIIAILIQENKSYYRIYNKYFFLSACKKI